MMRSLNLESFLLEVEQTPFAAGLHELVNQGGSGGESPRSCPSGWLLGPAPVATWGLAGAALPMVMSSHLVYVLTAGQLHDQLLVHRGMALKSKESRLFIDGKRAALILRPTMR